MKRRERRHSMPFGAETTADGVRFGLWAPAAQTVDVGVERDTDGPQWHRMTGLTEGWHRAVVASAGAGTRYRFRIDGSTVVPDPASRSNPDDVHGASEVVDPCAFDWRDDDWRGRPWREAVIYELHVGTFAPSGTFAGVAERLDYLVDLGVTAIELMPIADFPGKRNWGYDGVLPFAPDASYGTPDDLKRLVVAAHRRGLMVLLDVVYNHFGPEGNYLHAYAPQFFTSRHRTPWGDAIDFDGSQSAAVRAFFVHNALYWLEEFHLDGLRFDAVHAIADDSSTDILTEIARRVHEGPGRERMIHLVLENDRNEARRLARDANARPRLYTAQWNDDIHHAAHALLTGERAGYYADYASAPLRSLGRCLAEGFAYQGEPSPYRGDRARGESSTALPPCAFVSFLQNHDQVGNRATGERLHMLTRDERLRAMVAVVLLAPSPPLLFMGEEFAAATPFLFFCNFEPALGAAVTRGRREEFKSFETEASGAGTRAVPDPSARETFEESRLDWSSLAQPVHAQWLALYRRLLALRRAEVVPLINAIVPGAATWRTSADGALGVRWPLVDGRALVLDANLGDADRPRTTPPAQTHVIYATPNADMHDRALPPWSVQWRIDSAQAAQPR